MRSRFHLAMTVLGLLTADRWLKYLALSDQELPLGGFFSFKLYRNPALVFSLPNPAPALLPLIIAFIIALLAKQLLACWSKKQKSQVLGLLLIIAGALSNLADRIGHGFVIDYFALFSRGFFNLADLMIAVGVLRLIIKKECAPLEVFGRKILR